MDTDFEVSTQPVELYFSTETLLDAVQKGLNLYCIVNLEDDKLCPDEAYWASNPNKPEDLYLEDIHPNCFFDESDELDLEIPSHGLTIDLPITATEYRLMKNISDFETHVYGLMKNGCEHDEAYKIATSHLTGLPTTVFHKIE